MIKYYINITLKMFFHSHIDAQFSKIMIGQRKVALFLQIFSSENKFLVQNYEQW